MANNKDLKLDTWSGTLVEVNQAIKAWSF